MVVRKAISTSRAPAPGAPYSQAIQIGELVFTAGCLGINPETGEIESGVEAQTRRALQNIDMILQAAGTSLENVIKTACFLKKVEDFKIFNRVYAEFFSNPSPARTTVQARLTRDEFLVEIEAVAVIPTP